MGAATETLDIIRGGSFLVEEHPLDQVFIPEEFTEEEEMIGDLVADFVEGSVVPRMDELEARELEARVSHVHLVRVEVDRRLAEARHSARGGLVAALPRAPSQLAAHPLGPMALETAGVLSAPVGQPACWLMRLRQGVQASSSVHLRSIASSSASSTDSQPP